MHNNCTERENNMHNYTYATNVFTSYHRPKCLKHDIVANVPRQRRARLEIVELSFNRSFDDMTIIEIIIFFVLRSYLHWQYGYVKCLQ